MRTSPARHLTTLPTVFGVGLLTVACGGQDQSLDEAEKTLEKYFEAVADGDEAACDLETEDWAEENEEFFDEKDCEDRVDAAKALYKAFDVDFDDASYEAKEGGSDDEALVTVDYADGDEETYVLVYEDGEWLIDDEHDDDTSDDSDGSGDSMEGDGDDEEPEAEEVVLPLTKGSSLTLAGNDDSGTTSDDTPFTVSFDTLTCGATIPKASHDENYETSDLVADEGNQICIVELAATNDSKGPATFSSANDANIRTADGTEYSETDENFDDQGFLTAKDRKPSYTTDQVQPGETKYDVIAYELPLDAEPVELVYTSDE